MDTNPLYDMSYYARKWIICMKIISLHCINMNGKKIQIERCKFWGNFLTQEMWDNNPLKFFKEGEMDFSFAY
jgi:hypothetical protein